MSVLETLCRALGLARSTNLPLEDSPSPTTQNRTQPALSMFAAHGKNSAVKSTLDMPVRLFLQATLGKLPSQTSDSDLENTPIAAQRCRTKP